MNRKKIIAPVLKKSTALVDEVEEYREVRRMPPDRIARSIVLTSKQRSDSLDKKLKWQQKLIHIETAENPFQNERLFSYV